MAQQFSGLVEILNGAQSTTIALDGDVGTVTIGGGKDEAGELVIRDGRGQIRVQVDATTNRVRIFDAAGDRLVQLGPDGALVLGGAAAGGISVLDAGEQQRIQADAADGRVRLRDGGEQTRIDLEPERSRIRIFDAAGRRLVNLGPNGILTLGGDGEHGAVTLQDANGAPRVVIGAEGNSVQFLNASGTLLAELGGGANLRLGGTGSDGDLSVRASNNVETLRFNGDTGNMELGGQGRDGDLALKNTNDVTTIRLDGGSGDIILQNADCAEDFEVSAPDGVEPGTVMVIGDDARLRASDRPYDRRVAGIVAGAGAYRPGIVLGRRPGASGTLPIALVGRVACRVDAAHGPVRVGDLLTTSASPGHAMRASDSIRAPGAVIGKALGSLTSGRGLVPVLVALQ